MASEGRKYPAVPTETYREGGRLQVFEVNGRSVGICQLEDGNFVAIRNTCPHKGAPLCRGELEGTMSPSRPGEYVFDNTTTVVKCPWHGWEFDARSGEGLFG